MPRKLPIRIGRIVRRVQAQVAASKLRANTNELRARVKDAPPVRSFYDALAGGFSLIAEIKRKSPSKGWMLHRDVEKVAELYAQSRFVRAVSVLTNEADFGMRAEALREVRAIVPQPILRKDFIVDEHQVYEARALGADAVLLMASVLLPEELKHLSEVADSLGMDVLFEAHLRSEIESFPASARICGINSRSFTGRAGSFKASRFLTAMGWRTTDLSTDLSQFQLQRYLPRQSLKVAESGIKPDAVRMVYEDYHFDAILVGTSILMARDMRGALRKFEEAIEDLHGAQQRLPFRSTVPFVQGA